MTELVLRYFLDAQANACPWPLALHFSLGDAHLITAGGVLDQPAGAWQAQQHAGWVWHLLTEENEATETYPLEKRLKASEITYLRETIRPLRQRIIANGE